MAGIERRLSGVSEVIGTPRSLAKQRQQIVLCRILRRDESVGGTPFPYGWNNPGHEQLPNLITHNLALPINTRRRIKQLVLFLRDARENADYRPGRTVDRTTALVCLHRARTVLQDLEVQNE